MIGHTPVLLNEIISALNPTTGAIIVDATFGGGGYSRAILEAAPCVVWGIDRDADALARGAELAKSTNDRLALLHGRFGNMCALLHAKGIEKVDGIVLDLGVSSFQLDDQARGFSFRGDGPLDMRMDQSDEAGPNAADFVNSASEENLANIIYAFGEERASRRIARAIVRARSLDPILTTGALADIVRDVMPSRHSARRLGPDPATKTFQAIRIHVNGELDELDRGLAAAETLLKPGGRLAVVSFHSLEDRRVKSFMKLRAGEAAAPSRHLPITAGDARAPSFQLISKRAIKPQPEEIAANPRSRSARLRAAIRTEAPIWGPEEGGASA